ncbi:MAG: tail fiber domain-containing protein [Saprospiraceae bacterium]|nr:tail fiber domain-containing protein [Saprospiraceae bacterium]
MRTSTTLCALSLSLSLLAQNLDVDGNTSISSSAGNTELLVNTPATSTSSLKLFEAGEFGFQFEYDGALNVDKLYLRSRGFAGNDAIRMTWLKNGKVGIGTTSPGAVVPNTKLDVRGGHLALDNNFGVLSQNSTGTGFGAGMDTESDDALSFYAGESKRMQISKDGNVSIGADPVAARFHVKSESGFKGAIFDLGTNSSNIEFYDEFADPVIAPSSASTGLIGTVVNPFFEIRARRFYAETASDYLTWSDARLKENIQPLQDALAILNGLQAVTYVIKDTLMIQKRHLNQSDRQAQQEIGFLAQEVEQVLPSLVHDDPKSGYKAVGYLGLIPVLVDGIKTLHSQNIKIEHENDILKVKLDALNKRIEEIESTRHTELSARYDQLDHFSAGEQEIIDSLQQENIDQRSELESIKQQMSELFEMIGLHQE